MLVGGVGCQINNGKGKGLTRCNHLHGLFVDDSIGSPQDLMALEESDKTLFKGGKVQRAGKPKGRCHGIGGATRVKLFQQPQALLGKGQGQPALS